LAIPTEDEKKKFWTQKHSDEYRRIIQMRTLYEGKHCIVLYDREGGWKLPIYVTHNWLGDRLTNTLTSMCWRQFPYIKAEEKNRQDDVQSILKDAAIRTLTANTQNAVSYAGYASLYLTWSQRLGMPILRRWGENIGEFAWWELEGHTPWAVTFYKEEMLAKYKGRENVRVKVGERFELDPQKKQVMVTNSAYLVSSTMGSVGSFTDPWNLAAEKDPSSQLGGVNLDENIPLNIIYPNNTPKDKAVMNMDCLPGCPVENTGEGLGTTDYTESLISLQKSMARLATQRDIAIVINEMPALNVPAHCLNPDGTLDLGKIWVTMSDPGEDPKNTIPINFNNWTGNLNESAKQWELNDAAFYALSGLSPAIDGKAVGGGGESGYARMLGLIKPTSAIEMRRLHWDPVFEWMMRAVPQIDQSLGKGKYGDSINDIAIMWPTVIPEDPDTLTTRIGQGFQKWVSRKTAVTISNPTWSPDQVDSELKQLNDELDEASAIATAGVEKPDLGNLPSKIKPEVVPEVIPEIKLEKGG